MFVISPASIDHLLEFVVFALLRQKPLEQFPRLKTLSSSRIGYADAAWSEVRTRQFRGIQVFRRMSPRNSSFKLGTASSQDTLQFGIDQRSRTKTRAAEHDHSTMMSTKGRSTGKSMFLVQTFNVLHGPNLRHELPGVRFSVGWPNGFGPNEHAASSRALGVLAQSRFLGPHISIDEASNSALASMEEPSSLVVTATKSTLDFLVSLTGAPAGYALTTRDSLVSLHHSDGNLAAFAAHVGLTVAAQAVRAALAPAAASQDLSAIETTLRDAQKRWDSFAIGETGWQKIRAAERRNIPWRKLLSSEKILQYGYGHRQIRIRNSLTENEGQIAATIATNKFLASQLLRNNGLPAPANGLALDRSSATRLAQSLGFPVVVKPNSTDFGTAVSVNLRTDAEVAAAFDRARQFGPVLIEKHLPGINCRLLVMHGRFLSVVRQDPAHVIGDGVLSIEQLVENANRGRSNELSSRLKKIKFDDDVLRILAGQGFTVATVPAAGRRVALREHSNLSVGGTFKNISSILHPDNKILAERAAEIVGLRVAGVDFITTDPACSYVENGGAICEINPAPGFVMGEPEFKVEDAFLDGPFPNGGNGRIPLIAILSDKPVDEIAKRLEGIAQNFGHNVYVATPESLRSAGHCVAKGRFRQSMAVGAALQNRSATTAIVHLTRSGTAEEGLVFDRCDLAIVLAPSAEAFASEAMISDPVVALLAAHSGKVLHGHDMSAIEEAARDLFGPATQGVPSASGLPRATSSTVRP